MERRSYLWGIVVWSSIHSLQKHVHGLLQSALVHGETTKVEQTGDDGRMMCAGIPQSHAV
jgi:hypothetical protein